MIKKIISKKYWSFFGVVVSISFGIWGFYSTYFRVVEPELYFEEISQTRVIDLNVEISNLDIIYNDESIKNQNKELILILIRVINRGKKEISIHDYDDRALLGIKINEAELAEKPEIVDFSNDYIKNNLSFNLKPENTIEFSKIILNPNNYFSFKILVLTRAGQIPIIKPLGLLAGIGVPNYVKYSAVESPGIIEKLINYEMFPFVLILLSLIMTIIWSRYSARRSSIYNSKIHELYKEIEKLNYERNLNNINRSHPNDTSIDRVISANNFQVKYPMTQEELELFALISQEYKENSTYNLLLLGDIIFRDGSNNLKIYLDEKGHSRKNVMHFMRNLIPPLDDLRNQKAMSFLFQICNSNLIYLSEDKIKIDNSKFKIIQNFMSYIGISY